MLLLSTPFLSSITSQTVRGYCDRQSDLLLMYFSFSVINCMLNEWSDATWKSAHTGLPYLSELKRADSSPRIRELPSRLRMQLSTSADVFPLIPAMIFKHLCWMWIQKRSDLYGGGRARKWRPKWTEMDWKKKKTGHTECRTLNVDLFEGECTWHLNRHRN